MWLTGFDAPCCHTMVVDKPMAGHNLMQAIAQKSDGDFTAEAQWRGTTWTGANATCPEGGPPAGGIKGRGGAQSWIS